MKLRDEKNYGREKMPNAPSPMLAIAASSRVLCHPQRRIPCQTRATNKGAGDKGTEQGGYQDAWFRSTRAVLDSTSTETGRRKIIREYREANERANGGREREDLYTDNWDGDVYKGSPVNVLSVILAVSILAPLVGLIFALQTYGTLWG